MSDEVIVNLSLSCVIVILSLKLCSNSISILLSLLNKCSCLTELILSCSQLSCSKENLSLELSELRVKLYNSSLEFLLSSLLLSSLVVKGVNELVSQIVECTNNLFNSTLVGEVLLSGECKECLD